MILLVLALHGIIDFSEDIAVTWNEMELATVKMTEDHGIHYYTSTYNILYTDACSVALNTLQIGCLILRAASAFTAPVSR